MTRRSDCPIANVLDYVGDKWSLLILRDMLFYKKCSFSELQTADEKMATNILASRLLQMEKDGLISKQVDPNDKRKKIYGLEQPGKDMLPILLEMMIWSDKYDPNTNAPKDFIRKIKADRQQVIEAILAS